jgi:hypothetical protein
MAITKYLHLTSFVALSIEGILHEVIMSGIGFISIFRWTNFYSVGPLAIASLRPSSQGRE